MAKDMQSKKVCHLTSVHQPNDIRIFIKECSTIASSGYETHLIATGVDDGIIGAVHLHGIQNNQSSRIKRMTKTVYMVYKKACSINADIYHFHDPELLPVGLLLKLHGKKTIYDVHEHVPQSILNREWIPSYLKKLISKTFEVFENIISKQMSAVITATPFIRERFDFLGKKAITVNNFPIKNELLVKEKETDNKENQVCYVGAINQNRGIFEMIRAIEMCNIKLVLAGEFSPKEQRPYAVTMTGWQLVEEWGQVNRKAVAKIISKSLAGLVLFHPIPNHVEAQPNKLFEYMSGGIPVIASNFPLWRDIVEGSACGICVDPLEPSEIANAISWIVNHPEEARQMGANGQRAVAEKYNWEHESKILLNVYQELLN